MSNLYPYYYYTHSPYAFPSYHPIPQPLPPPSYYYWIPTSKPFLPRGPPKKPAKSGYALWVGNLPHDATLMDLCRLFATEGIQSVLLIDRTNCAFVNYKSEQALKEGIVVFEERGGCLRGNHLTVKMQTSAEVKKNKNFKELGESKNALTPPMTSSSISTSSASSSSASLSPSPTSRYFICKSLTVQDLEASVKLGIWATQSHNEPIFNEAFKTCENVYLVFSVNKSGFFYGYARMQSEIPPPSTFSSYDSSNIQSPTVIQTAADPSIDLPRGRIVDDTPRCCLFWEVVEDDNNNNNNHDEPNDTASTSATTTTTTTTTTATNQNNSNWSLPFKIKWMSPSLSKGLPFSATNDLINAYNENLPVKIARDGVEIDPETGDKLLKLLDRM